MIRALVLKDFRLVRERLLWLVALNGLLLTMTGGDPRAAGAFGAMTVHLSVTLLLLHAGTVEEKSRADQLTALLPVTRQQIVAGRYLFVAALAAAFTAVYLAMLAAAGDLAASPEDWMRVGRQSLALTTVLWSIGLPLVLWFGVIRSQVALSLGLTLLPAVWLGLARAVFDVSGLAAFAAGPWLLPAAILMAGASYGVAVRLYERRAL